MWNLSIYVVTWNVSQKYPDNITLNDLLDVDTSLDKSLPDIYIVGLQEVNANPQNIVTNFFKSDPWVQKIKDLLKPLDYLVAKTEQMQGLLMTIFVKRKHLYHIREIEGEYTRTGFGGMWGNKGAVVVRMTLYGCSIALVNSHLAAHDHMLEERISDYQRIKDATKFSVKVSQSIYEHDYVFWFGDLNFRLYGDDSSNLSPEEIREMIKREQLSELLKKDQLMITMCEGRAFSELVERLPQFPPTFKFEPGTSEYDMKRRPAWCDRILYKAKNKVLKNCSLQLEQLSYKSHPNYKLSDHKPVSSEFRIKVKELFHAHVLKPRKPLITNSLSIAAHIPVLITSIVKQPVALSPSLSNDNDAFFDAPDHFSDDEFDDGQAPEDDISNMVIHFHPLAVWNNSEDNKVDYVLPPGFADGGADWIGVYRENYTGFDEYIGYEYTETHHDKPYAAARTVKIDFSASIDLPLEGKFILLYFQSTGMRGHTSMMGVSGSFPVIKRCPSPRYDNID